METTSPRFGGAEETKADTGSSNTNEQTGNSNQAVQQ